MLNLSSFVLHAQKVSYFDLARTNNNQSFFIKQLLLPTKSDSTTKFALLFKTGYSFLAFKKIDEADKNDPQANKYFATLEMNMEIFKNPKRINSTNDDRSFSQENLETAGRASWKDTVFTKSYEQTQASNVFIQGKLELELPPGRYGYILQLVRTAGASEENSRRQIIEIPEYDNAAGNFYFMESDANLEQNKAKLINFGSNIHFGKDFKSLIHIPTYNPFKEYELVVTRMRPNTNTDEQDKEDEPGKPKPVFTQKITSDMVYNNYFISLLERDSDIILDFQKVKKGESYLFMSVPNSGFQNASYRLALVDKKKNETVASTVYQSRWVDIPTSLLNIDVAIEMLRFILPEEQVKKMQQGDRAEKQQAFNNFWKPKDPTPNTEFNEIMAEYYRRIDYAYRNYSSFRVPGFEMDQGNIYIKYGPPISINREFPTDSPVLEFWKYRNVTFVFEATSGFGDFKLIDTRKNS